MAEVMLLRHAERRHIRCVRDAMHIKLTWRGRRKSASFGRSLARAFDEAEMGVVSSRLERCCQTAQVFRKGYGKDADILEPDPTGELTYIVPEMVSMTKAGIEHRMVVEAANASGQLERIPKMFEGGYDKAMASWLAGEFKSEFISPISVYEGMLGIIKSSNKKLLIIFVSDIQVSAVSSIIGIKEFVGRRPGYLEGIWTENHATGNWRLFDPSNFMPAPWFKISFFQNPMG